MLVSKDAGRTRSRPVLAAKSANQRITMEWKCSLDSASISLFFGISGSKAVTPFPKLDFLSCGTRRVCDQPLPITIPSCPFQIRCNCIGEKTPFKIQIITFRPYGRKYDPYPNPQHWFHGRNVTGAYDLRGKAMVTDCHIVA